MEDLYEIYARVGALSKKLDEDSVDCVEKLRAILYKTSVQSSNEDVVGIQNPISPRPKTKRAKCLPSLVEVENEDERRSRGLSLRSSNKSSLTGTALIGEVNATEVIKIKKEKQNLSLESDATENIVGSGETVPQPPQSVEMKKQPTETILMPPPLVPTVQEPNEGRPKRMAKIKSEMNLKEPKLNQKLRRPSNFNESMPLLSVSTMQSKSKTSVSSTASDESVVVVPQKTPSVVDLSSDVEQIVETHDSSVTRQLSVKIKREKFSISSTNSEQATSTEVEEQTKEVIEATVTVPMPIEMPLKEERLSKKTTDPDTTSSTTTTNTTNKRGRKKKENTAKPIKVERFSDIDKLEAPISSRTRHGSIGDKTDESDKADKQAEQRSGSIYEDAVENLPDNAKTQINDKKYPTSINNETITVAPASDSNGAIGDTTFQVNTNPESTFVLPNPNATITLPSKNADATFNVPVIAADATFNVPTHNKEDRHSSFVSAKQSIETAKDRTQPENDSLITEDESFDKPLIEKKLPPPPKPPVNTKVKSSAKAYKMPTRTNELFDPLIQSPVKMKVKAFETVAHTATNTEIGRPKRTKENAMPHGQSNTPIIGKLFGPSMGRFLTPTQASNITPNTMANAKKGPSSASKAIGLLKPTTATSATSSKGKTLVRENSADDFRKGLHLLAEERKKQREQKHILAAQQREAKERERAERMARLAKEREEKRIKKQLESEQKKRDLEEIQRKLRNEESAAAIAASEAAKMKAAKAKLISDQERLMLQQMKHAGNMKSMLPPPPPRVQTRYTFEMLHTDDSSDEEGKVTYKRPPAPTWSRSTVRGPAIRTQQYWPTEIIDNFFSVQPMTADLRVIFPNIDAHQLRRNSSVLWSTPPRYSELPTY